LRHLGPIGYHQRMLRLALAPLVATVLVLPGIASARDPGGHGYLSIDGREYGVRWDDGDSFKIEFGNQEGTKVRMVGYNTLEDYGPVHRWGSWRAEELFAIAKRARDVASAGRWSCTSTGKPDRYGRILTFCPDLAAELIAKGLAMVFAVDGPADPKLVELQLKAQADKAGMWLKGVPPKLITSAHSAEEEKGYNRVVDTRTGVSQAVANEREYEECEWVCVGPAQQQSCMLYVAFERRYKQKPKCLK
jgi:endonuclease YncB( thermonuclease family)